MPPASNCPRPKGALNAFAVHSFKSFPFFVDFIQKGKVKRRGQKEGSKGGIKRRDQKEGSKGGIKRRGQKEGLKGNLGSL